MGKRRCWLGWRAWSLHRVRVMYARRQCHWHFFKLRRDSHPERMQLPPTQPTTPFAHFIWLLVSTISLIDFCRFSKSRTQCRPGRGVEWNQECAKTTRRSNNFQKSWKGSKCKDTHLYFFMTGSLLKKQAHSYS